VLEQAFFVRLLELFDSEDPRERDYLKTILHRAYGKFMNLRAFLRRAIANIFFRFVFETGRHNGIAELLEVLGSIINGFALPLKEEHLVFLDRALLPLHRPRGMGKFHVPLAFAVTQFVEKDPATSVTIINGLLKVWPWTNSAKQILFLNELEEIMELVSDAQLESVLKPLFRHLSRCIGSDHFQVAERALFLWNNGKLLATGCLAPKHTERILPIIYKPLSTAAESHWNSTIEELAEVVLKHYRESDAALFKRCVALAEKEEEEKAKEKEEREKAWKELEEKVEAMPDFGGGDD
jgi:serine/threonine-protein phosphatase 2A regulatory subunit B'